MTDCGEISVLIYAGSSDYGTADGRYANAIPLYRPGSMYNHFGIRVDVPTDLLSRAALRLLDLLRGNLCGGPVSLGNPRLMTRRRRVGVLRAAEVLGMPTRHAQILIDTYGDESVGEAVVCEDVSDGLYPRAASPAVLAREINRLADRAGLVVKLPGEKEDVIVNACAAAIDETQQVERWSYMLKRAAISDRYA